MSGLAPLLGEKQTSGGGLFAATDFMSTHPSHGQAHRLDSGNFAGAHFELNAAVKQTDNRTLRDHLLTSQTPA
jgi:hypothetical protein